MSDRHGREYIGKHRKPDDHQREGPITDVLRATMDLFTHPPLHQHDNHRKEKKHG